MNIPGCMPAEVCPQCGYRVEDPAAVRCPRCNKLLFEMAGCRGNCSSCGKKGSGGVKEQNGKK
ncbi:MAG: hypothetical protein K6T80_00175 [Firmicutes bacterium]|nr:hypothetical protein [Bacillota bacterium]